MFQGAVAGRGRGRVHRVEHAPGRGRGGLSAATARMDAGDCRPLSRPRAIWIGSDSRGSQRVGAGDTFSPPGFRFGTSGASSRDTRPTPRAATVRTRRRDDVLRAVADAAGGILVRGRTRRPGGRGAPGAGRAGATRHPGAPPGGPDPARLALRPRRHRCCSGCPGNSAPRARARGPAAAAGSGSPRGPASLRRRPPAPPGRHRGAGGRACAGMPRCRPGPTPALFNAGTAR